MSGGKVLIDAALRSAVNVRSSKIPSEVAKSSTALLRAFGAGAGGKAELPDLSYDYGALERKFVSVFSLLLESTIP